MALNADKLKASPALAGLTEEQIKAVTELSTNDETAVIGERIGKFWGDIDRDVEETTGLKKPEGVKTFAWLKSDVFSKVGASSKLQKKLDTLKGEKEELEKQLKDGKVDEAIAKKLKDNEQLVKDLQGQMATEKTKYEKQLTDAQSQNVSIMVNNEFDRALVGKKFKDEAIIPKSVRESYIGNAKQAILSENTPDWIDDGRGGKTLVFRDANGDIKRNPENNLNPFTASELFTTKIADVLDQGKNQGGAGTGGKGAGGGKTSELSLSGVKTQVEADDTITDYLMGKGLVRGTAEYNQEFDQIRTENNVADLDIR